MKQDWSDVVEELATVKAELEASRKRETAMRDFIQLVCGHTMALAHGEPVSNLIEFIEREGGNVLKQPSVGSRYLSPEQCKPLVEALQMVWDDCEMGYITGENTPKECGMCGSIAAHSKHCLQGKLETAITYARTLGL